MRNVFVMEPAEPTDGIAIASAKAQSASDFFIVMHPPVALQGAGEVSAEMN